MEGCRGAALFFCIAFFLLQAEAANLSMEKGDSIVLDSSNTDYSWSENITYSSSGLEKEGKNLSFLRSSGMNDIFYSVFSNTSEKINLSFFSQRFYGDPVSGEKVLSFNASAVPGSRGTFRFGGAPASFSTAYDVLTDGSRIFQADSGQVIEWNFTEWSTHNFEFESNETDLVVGNITFNNSDPVQGQKVKFTADVANKDTENLTADFNFTEKEYNGTSYVHVSNRTRRITVQNQSIRKVNFTFDAPIGNYNYSLRADIDDEISETNESNNFNSSLLNVSSYQVFYGGTELVYRLGNQTGLRDWKTPMPEGNLYYADEEADYSLRDLSAANGSDDLAQVTDSLNLQGHSDSVSNIFDSDGDGVSDKTACFNVVSTEVCDVPIVNSTNTSNFVTGILYDSADGKGFDGSQDLIFTTKVYNSTKQGAYGEYNYEVKIPSTLDDQVLEGDFINYQLELK